MQEEQLDAVFHALSNRTRRALLNQLAAQPASVTQLAVPHDMSLNAVSKHLMVLERAGLIIRTRQPGGQTCELCAEPMAAAEQWISAYEEYWGSTLDRLAAYVERDGRER